MQDRIFNQIEALNEGIDNATHDASTIKSYSRHYFELLRLYLPELLSSIATEDDSKKYLKTLKQIFPLQRNLMRIRIIAGVAIDDDLWEIAEDFDNDDPNRYDYLIQTIKNKGYLLQK